MGYYTQYVLDEAPAGFREALAEALNYDPFEDACKWYDHEQDIARVMIAGNFGVVKIRGQGREDEVDVWDKEFTLSNEVVTCKIFSYNLVRDDQPIVKMLAFSSSRR